MLHCVRFDPTVRGGRSTFLDAHLAAELLRQRDPDAFRVLTRVPCTFLKAHAKRARPALFRYHRPHISVNAHDDVIAVFWSPQFEGPLDVPPEDVEPYFAAYRQFQLVLQDSEVLAEHLIEMRLGEGDLVTFNQRRFLHGRESFAAGGAHGTRHLQGTYLSLDEALSEWRELRRRAEREDDLTEAQAGTGSH